MHRARKAIAASVAVFFMLWLSAHASMTGTVTDVLNVRQAPNTSSDIVGKLYPGDSVEILDNSGNWYLINYNGNKVYVSADYVKTDSGVAAAPSSIGRGVVNTDALNIRQEPTVESEIIGRLVNGDVVNLTGRCDGWYRIEFSGRTGYVCADYVIADRSVPVISREISPRGRDLPTTGQRVAEYAKQFVGVPYVSGGSTPSGFDCSGFTYYVYKQFGYDLPHSSSAQAGYGVEVDKPSLQPGDLVFFSYYGNHKIEHVGIYLGNGQFIHSTVPGSTVKISSLNTPYYESNYITARRLEK